MTYKVVCRKCGGELETKDFKKYLGKDKDGYVVPVTKIVVELCPKCSKEDKDAGYLLGVRSIMRRSCHGLGQF